MTGAVFFETLRRHWLTAVYWGIGIIVYGVIALLILPNQEALQQYVNLLRTVPSGLMSAFGLEDVALIGTPEGFLGYSYFLYIILVIAVYAVLAGLNITANEEDSGVLDMVLSLPIPRWRIIVEKFLAYGLLLLLIIVMGFVGLVVGRMLNVHAQPLEISTLLSSSLNMFPSGVLVLAFTTLAAVIVRRRGTAAALAGGFVVASYLIDILGTMTRNAVGDALGSLSFFRHYDAMQVLLTGIRWESVTLVLVASVILTAAALVMFERRDIGV